MVFDIKRWIEASLPFLRMAVALTATPWDDRAVDLLSKIVTDEELLPWLQDELEQPAARATAFESLSPHIQSRFEACGCDASVVTHFLQHLLPYLVEQLAVYLRIPA